MAFVLDASATACWAFDDEDYPDASAAFDRMRAEEGVIPSLWWFEVRNILIVNERRRRITESETGAFLLKLSRLRLREDRSPNENEVLRLARAHRLSVYDAAYLELALREGLPLATLDADLRRAALDEGVALVSGAAAPPKGSPPDPKTEI
jgi:predicted nucleic acid-binding protein